MRQVFARPEYRWTERRHPLQWLWNAWNTLLEWAHRTAQQHPVMLLPLALLLLALLAHLSWTGWKIYRSHVRPQSA